MDGHFSKDAHGRSWTLILVRALIDAHGRLWTVMDGHFCRDGHFSKDAHGR